MLINIKPYTPPTPPPIVTEPKAIRSALEAAGVAIQDPDPKRDGLWSCTIEWSPGPEYRSIPVPWEIVSFRDKVKAWPLSIARAGLGAQVSLRSAGEGHGPDDLRVVIEGQNDRA